MTQAELDLLKKYLTTLHLAYMEKAQELADAGDVEGAIYWDLRAVDAAVILGHSVFVADC